jgi:hypothetical protein
MLQFMTVLTVSTVLSIIAYKMQHHDLRLISEQLNNPINNNFLKKDYLRD